MHRRRRWNGRTCAAGVSLTYHWNSILRPLVFNNVSLSVDAPNPASVTVELVIAFNIRIPVSWNRMPSKLVSIRSALVESVGIFSSLPNVEPHLHHMSVGWNVVDDGLTTTLRVRSCETPWPQLTSYKMRRQEVDIVNLVIDIPPLWQLVEGVEIVPCCESCCR